MSPDLLVQGIGELFPVSSLGHSILLPAWIGGQWAKDLDMSAPDSPYLALLVALHVATALALLVYYRREWTRIIVGLRHATRIREIRTPEARLGVLLILATIPVGVAGLLLEKAVRNYLGALLEKVCPGSVGTHRHSILVWIGGAFRSPGCQSARARGSIVDRGCPVGGYVARCAAPR
ncbi:undecaprenyl-diphosphate phosphatase [Nocardia bovistercoris]|uniref:Undecaprenyl-diphosphatase n=1 Tax=Nocardia bovistercoris TaxID=2785916 RepID=A0A931N2F9_9NOCA|nr:undecaprenyl-diphosphate phosphatase [Nocardia bovistercoris]MBH0776692.1 undecaprenyl-diphosphate phosphatase [Nocardia bovistercoris]